MKDSNIFVFYASPDSNVTVSPRSGNGHFPPEVNNDSKVNLLEGSGVSDGKMIANVRCDNCLSWDGGSMDPTDSSSSWIWSMKGGNSLESSDFQEEFSYHDARGVFTLDLGQAKSKDSVNPFLEFDLNDPANSGSAIGSSSLITKRSAHGLIMSIAFVVLFPIFALGLHIIPYQKTVPHIHAPLQVITLCLAIAGFGLGISLAIDVDKVSGYHPIIGIVVMSLLVLLQPALGLFHHLEFRKTGKGSSLGVAHRWLGRVVLVLAIINGGLGFKFSGIGNPGVPKAGAIAYGTIAGVFGVLYIVIVVFHRLRRTKGSHGAHAGSDSSTSGPKIQSDQGAVFE